MKSLIKTYITSNTGAFRANFFLNLLLISQFCDIEIINGIFYYTI